MKKIAIAIVIFGILIAGFMANRTPKSPDFSKLKLQLEKEFRGAYPKKIAPNGNLVELEMTAEEGEIEIFEGKKTKVWNYNKTVPGPEIRMKLGDTLKINFTNNLPQETTIHFHGVRVPNAMDGVPGVTQPPIEPGGRFVYEFTPKDAGTFWFHPHVRSAEQVERGLFGVLIVEEPESKYSRDEVWVIDDWRLISDAQIDPNFGTPMDLMHDGRWGNVITTNASLSEKLEVRPGTRLRLRFVNASNARVYKLDFGTLNAIAIAVDGMNVKKVFNAQNFELAPGNRLDVDVKIPRNSVEKSFPIRDIFTRRTNKLGEIVVAGEPIETPDFEPILNSKIPDWNEAKNYPIDKKYKLNARRNARGEIEWTINGKAFPEYDPFTLKFDEFNKLSFVNESSRLHPMHLHGQFFKVISRNGNPATENFFRDTVLVKPKETVEIATVPLDRGKWLNHCHILEHADAGMITITTVE